MQVDQPNVIDEKLITLMRNFIDLISKYIYYVFESLLRKNAMKKLLLPTFFGLSTLAPSQSVQAIDNVGVAVNYGLISGPAMELTYPINDMLQVRGALSTGMGLSESASDTDITYDVKADGGINRLSMDYHPFSGTFFLSAGYAFNDFKLKSNGSKTAASVEVGNDTFSGTVKINGNLEWDSAPMLSLGWGHSPSKGWGAMFEMGAIFTGGPNVSLTGTLNDASNAALDAALKDEEIELKKDIGDYDFLPILQAGITYRF